MSWFNLLTNILGAGVPNLPIHLLNIICKLWQGLGNFGFGISQQDLKYVQFSEQTHSSNCSSFDVRFVQVSFLDWPIFHNFNRSNRSKCRRSLPVAFYWIARGKKIAGGKILDKLQFEEKKLCIFLDFHESKIKQKRTTLLHKKSHINVVFLLSIFTFYHI